MEQGSAGNLQQLIISNWDELFSTLMGKLEVIEQHSEEYEKLEKVLQKYEAEVRKHIRMEQQLKLYAESIQQKLDESEQQRSDLLEQSKL